jgi:hypothetical protein
MDDSDVFRLEHNNEVTFFDCQFAELSYFN